MFRKLHPPVPGSGFSKVIVAIQVNDTIERTMKIDGCLVAACMYAFYEKPLIDAHAHPVELAFLGLDTYKATPRSSADENAEDDFARKLRLIGGKWWHCYGDFQNAKMTTRRRLYPDEAEVLFLGWPKKGGVWVLRFEKSKKMKGFEGLRLINGASTMEERCKAIEMAGGSFFERPEDSEFVRPYVEGLGEREERKEIESYLEGGYEGY